MARRDDTTAPHSARHCFCARRLVGRPCSDLCHTPRFAPRSRCPRASVSANRPRGASPPTRQQPTERCARCPRRIRGVKPRVIQVDQGIRTIARASPSESTSPVTGMPTKSYCVSHLELPPLGLLQSHDLPPCARGSLAPRVSHVGAQPTPCLLRRVPLPPRALRHAVRQSSRRRRRWSRRRGPRCGRHDGGRQGRSKRHRRSALGPRGRGRWCAGD